MITSFFPNDVKWKEANTESNDNDDGKKKWENDSSHFNKKINIIDVRMAVRL